jgi:uncharacterized membrane protein
MKNKYLQYVSLICIMLVTGVFWGTWFTLTRSIEHFTPEAFLAIGNTIIQNVAWPMRILMPSTLLLMLLSLWFYPVKKSAGFYTLCLSFILMVITLLITVMIEVPIDNMIKTWTVSSMPDNWEMLRAKWQYYHTMRTFTSIGSFVSFLAALVLVNRN